MSEMPNSVQLYDQIIGYIFLSKYNEGDSQIDFEREDLVAAVKNLNIALPKNLGDVIYTYRYRRDLPIEIQAKAPLGKEWIIRGIGPARYRFEAVVPVNIVPNTLLAETKIPDATPGIIIKYALNDEQALLAKLRYNRLIDIFTGVTCYSLQNHLRTTVRGIGQVETDEIYIGIDQRGAHYVFPVQAKGGKDRLNMVQIQQDFALCEEKFPHLICRTIAAQFVGKDLIALFELELTDSGLRISAERHYRLVEPDQITSTDLQTYKRRIPDSGM